MSVPEIQVAFPGGLKVNAEYRGFTIATDQPVRDGGEGGAPAPFDLFLASLATCAGYYVLAFCRPREIPTDGLGLTMRMEKNPETKMIGRIAIAISLPPGFPERYKEAVVRAAEACAVKAHIQKPPLMEVMAEIRPA
ncbi:MAG: osmotically inducible protein OsmC [Candidatus Aminicenantes bacterium]|nr:osmotically inducible protein OsmC [Candidatus Aminicenantes bacterium]